MRIRDQMSPSLITERRAGYDTGVISGALVTIGSDLGVASLSDLQKVRCPTHAFTYVLPTHTRLLPAR